MNTGLQKYFPMIRTRAEVLAEIQNQPKLSGNFQNWKKEQQEEFLDCVTGAKGVKILYDAFFKEIMNPETTPERLEQFLSLVLGESVKIKCVLPTDNSRIADESSLLIMDILIELEDGSLANLEAQKVGYMFPGQRMACYSADLLLRQYKRVRGEKGEGFSRKLAEAIAESGEENAYMECPFGIWMEKDERRFAQTIACLTNREQEYLLGIRWAQHMMYHRLNDRMREIGMKLVKNTEWVWNFFFIR